MTDAWLRELLAHFFQTLLPQCPACGADDCVHWRAVRSRVPVAREQVEMLQRTGFRPAANEEAMIQ